MKIQFDRKWLIFLVQINQELKISDQLARANIQCYVPTQPVLRRWGNKEQWITKIITPRMIFVHVHEKEQNKIMELPFKINYLLTEDKKPVIVSKQHLQTLICILNQNNIPVEISIYSPAHGTQSRITKGPLKDLEGLHHTIDNNSYISFPFDPLGFITIPIKTTDLEPVQVSSKM